jgi:hypothetical protein
MGTSRWSARATGLVALLVGLGLVVVAPAASADAGPVDRSDPDSAANLAAAVGDDAVAPQAAGTPVAGYVWAHDPTAASYTAVADWSHNSAGGTNTITRTGVGSYTVVFGGIGSFTGGVAHVTPYGSTLGRCSVQSWGLSGVDEAVNIRCFDVFGLANDRRFLASYTLTTAGAFVGDVAYAWADDASNPSYTPNLSYQFDSAGGKIKITRPATGKYTVRIPNLGEANGTVKVSAYGATSNVCRVLSWAPKVTAQQVKVSCHNAVGVLVDSQFTISYLDGQNLAADDQMLDGYVWADEPGAASYTPEPLFSFNVLGNTNTIERLAGKGHYRVDLPELLAFAGGTAQVTAYGSGTTICQVESFNPSVTGSALVNVLCFNADGSRANSRFTMQFADPGGA